jgi:hypothetical protein
MAGTVTPNLTTISLCEATTGWSAQGGSNTLNADNYVQGSYCIHNYNASATARGADYDMGSGGTSLTNQTIYCWFAFSKKDNIPVKGSTGLRLRLTDTSGNYSEWDIAGSDTLPHGGWIAYAIQTSVTPSRNSATPANIGSIRYCGWRCGGSVIGKTYIYFDAFRYGTGLSIKGGTSGTPISFEDLYLEDSSSANAYGVIDKVFGVYYAQGAINIGSTTNGDSTYFKSTGQVLVFKDAQVGPAFYQINLQGNSTANTEVYFGDLSGGRGITGDVIMCEKATQVPKYGLYADGPNITSFGFYGTSFVNASAISFPTYSGTKSIVDCSFQSCSEVVPSTTTMQYDTFVAATGVALRMATTSHHISDCSFVNCAAGVGITGGTGEYTFDGMKFAGCTKDVRNSVASADVVINCINDSNATTYENTGVPAGTVTISNPVSLTLTGLVPTSEVRIYGSSQGGTTSGTLSSFSETLTVYSGGLQSYSIRQILPFSEAGESVRIKVKSPELGILKIDNASIGIQDSGINTVSTPVEIKWGGSSGVTLSGGALGSATVVLSDTLDSDYTSFADDSIRQVVPFGTGGTQVRVRFKAHSTSRLDFKHASIGKQDTGLNTVATPVELKFGGSSGMSISNGGTIWSDWTDFSTTGGQNQVIIFDCSTSYGDIQYTVTTSVERYWKGDAESWNESAPTGFGTPAVYNYSIDSIEVRSVTGSAVEAWSDWTTFNSVEGNQVIIFDMASTNSGIAYATGTSVSGYYKGATDSWNQSSVTGFTGPTDYDYGISEVEVYYENTTVSGEIVEFDGTESCSSTFQYLYNYSAGTYVDIVVHHLDYQYLRMNNYELPSSDTSLPISQVIDRNYKNP